MQVSKINEKEQLKSRVESKMNIEVELSIERDQEKEHTNGSMVNKEQPVVKEVSGGWLAGILVLDTNIWYTLILVVIVLSASMLHFRRAPGKECCVISIYPSEVNQGLATLAFFGVSVNLVLFLTRVLKQNNADAANNISKWTGTVYMFSLFGALLGDSCWGRYKSCTIFQVIFVIGLVMLSVSSQLFLLRPSDCGDEHKPCRSHTSMEIGLFYFSIYLVALGNGGYQTNIVAFGSDQFDEDDPKESQSKVRFFSYFYLALNLGSLVSNTILCYIEEHRMWKLGFWISVGSAFLALVLFLCGSTRYRYSRPSGNPMSQIAQVITAAFRKRRVEMLPEEYIKEMDGKEYVPNCGSGKIIHTEGFSFLDKATVARTEDFKTHEQSIVRDPWKLCTVTQVEEIKSILRLFPIWICTIMYSVVFTQMASLFVEQGATMNTRIMNFSIPSASMSTFDILSIAVFILVYNHIIQPRIHLSQLQRMGMGLIIATLAMVSAGLVEKHRLEHAQENSKTSSLSIWWQVPQYVLIGASEVFMYVGQLEFFNDQAPGGLKSFGTALYLTSMSLGNFASDMIVTIVMKVTIKSDGFGWIPDELNKGHMERFFFLLAAMCLVDFVIFLVCAKRYRYVKAEEKHEAEILVARC